MVLDRKNEEMNQDERTYWLEAKHGPVYMKIRERMRLIKLLINLIKGFAHKRNTAFALQSFQSL